MKLLKTTYPEVLLSFRALNLALTLYFFGVPAEERKGNNEKGHGTGGRAPLAAELKSHALALINDVGWAQSWQQWPTQLPSVTEFFFVTRLPLIFHFPPCPFFELPSGLSRKLLSSFLISLLNTTEVHFYRR